MKSSSAARALDEPDGPIQAPDAVDLCLASVNFHPVYAGPAVRFRAYAPGLRRRGVETRVVTASQRDGETRAAGEHARGKDGDTDRGSAPTAGEMDRVDEIPVRRVRLSSCSSARRRWWEYQQYLVELCGDPESRPDVLQLLTVDPWSTYYLYRIRGSGVPTVYTHTMLTKMSPRPWKRALQRLYWPLPYRFLDCTVVSSSVMRESLRQIGVRGRIEVIPNGTDVERFRPSSPGEKRELRRELDLPADDPIVLFVGSISPRKGVDVLLEAWGRVGDLHRDAHLVLVGPRHDEIRPDEEAGDFFDVVKRALEGGGAYDRVTLTGAVDDVDDYYRAANVFVFPSRKEGMPNVVPEAYACGLPVVMTPFQGLPEEFGSPGEHHLLVERTPGEIAEAVCSLLESPDRCRELGGAAREWTERQLALETALDRYAALYRELAERKSDG